MKLLLHISLLLLTALYASAQVGADQMQKVSGIVIDKVSEQPLEGANIMLLNGNPALGAVTDQYGKFSFSVPHGRQTFVITYLGYKPQTIPEILVVAGKQTILEVKLEESINNVGTVEVVAEAKKDRANNEFSAVSARTFSMDEVTRYSGGRNDVARLAANFAGVATSNDARNDIVVRGNSPSAVLWRIEGIPVPSPNHFSTLGTSGGPVSALNTNMLKNSDFMTGAFAAEYGNTNSAVFDLGFRSGNTEKHEFMVQIAAFSGLEVLAEGPLTKKQSSSYLVSYRYSFAALAGALKLPIGTAALPYYQDLSFKFDLPGKPKYGKFSIFGVGAYSNINFIGKKTSEQDLFADPYIDQYVKSGFGTLGLRHNIMVGKNAYVRTVFSLSTSASLLDQYDYPDSTNRRLSVKGRDYNTVFRLSSFYNRKFSAKLSMRAGMLTELYWLYVKTDSRLSSADWKQQRNFNGVLAMLQPFTQFQYKPIEIVTFNFGLHGQLLTNNGSYSIEPRAAVSVQPHPKHTITFAYGWHSQMQPLPVYFYRTPLTNGDYDESNMQLDFTRAHHIVLAYDAKLANDWRIKLEPYIQFITGAPVDRLPSSFSILNTGADFTYPDRGFLTNAGFGRNYGAEFTLEKFFSKGYYGLLTVSVFDSKYKGSDGVWRNTAFNNRYIVNFLAGKEFRVGRKKRNAVTLDLRFATSGGRWYTPIDSAASVASGQEVLITGQAYTKQYPYYMRLDFKIGIRMNSKKGKLSQTLFFDFQNCTFRKNVFQARYNPLTGQINYVYQMGFFPDVLWRLNF